MRLDLEPSELLAQAIADSDLYIFFYDSSTLPNPRPDGPEFVRALQAVMAENWKKSLLFKDYGDYFYDTFSVEPQRIADLNATLIRRLSHASTLSFSDPQGSYFEAPLDSVKKWTDINGVGNFDLAPGEIATHSEAINGHVKFKGTFLSTIPFARKYGVLESPLELWIENSTISRIAIAQVCQPLALKAPNTEAWPAASLRWKGCGSNWLAKAMISAFVGERLPRSRTWPISRSSHQILICGLFSGVVAVIVLSSIR